MLQYLIMWQSILKLKGNINRRNQYWVHEEALLRHGGNPAPLNYEGVSKSVCVLLWMVVCHGIPSEVLRSWRTLTSRNADVSTIYNGYFLRLIPLCFLYWKCKSWEKEKLVQRKRMCLAEIGISKVKQTEPIGNMVTLFISHALENISHNCKRNRRT